MAFWTKRNNPSKRRKQQEAARRAGQATPNRVEADDKQNTPKNDEAKKEAALFGGWTEPSPEDSEHDVIPLEAPDSKKCDGRRKHYEETLQSHQDSSRAGLVSDSGPIISAGSLSKRRKGHSYDFVTPGSTIKRTNEDEIHALIAVAKNAAKDGSEPVGKQLRARTSDVQYNLKNRRLKRKLPSPPADGPTEIEAEDPDRRIWDEWISQGHVVGPIRGRDGKLIDPWKNGSSGDINPEWIKEQVDFMSHLSGFFDERRFWKRRRRKPASEDIIANTDSNDAGISVASTIPIQPKTTNGSDAVMPKN